MLPIMEMHFSALVRCGCSKGEQHQKYCFPSSYYEMKLWLPFCLLASVSLANAQAQSSRRVTPRPLEVLFITLPFAGHLYPALCFVDELVSRGHRVTVSVGVAQEDIANFKKLTEERHAIFHYFDSSGIQFPSETKGFVNFVTSQIDMFQKISLYSVDMLHSLNDSLTSGAYDIVIGDDFMMSLLACISSGWNIPAVMAGATTQVFPHLQPPWPWPGVLQASASENLTFLERMLSVMVVPVKAVVYKQLMMTPYKAALRDFCPHLTFEEFSEASGIYLPHIVPTVIGFEYPRPLTPLSEYVGPLVPRHPEPLSQSKALEQWLEAQPERGVVYVSMGSRFGLTLEMGRALLEGVMQTHYSLLWSLKKSSHWILDGLTIDRDRVFISEWTPQFSVLASKAIHSAILHGGFNGLNEALLHGVPVLGLPLMEEQVLNIGRLFHNGLGLRLDGGTLDSSSVAGAVAAIDGGQYRQNVRKLQKMFQLAGGVERAADLVEFYEDVGYVHLVPAYAKYRWSCIHYYNVDVWLVVASVVLLLVYINIKLLVVVTRCCCKRKPKTD